MRKQSSPTYAAMVAFLPAIATLIGVVVLAEIPNQAEIVGLTLGHHGRRPTSSRR